MDEMLSTLIAQLENKSIKTTKVIPWSCPVPSFGDFSQATVATVGLNPSNREFVDESGKELEGAARRLHTLKSLGITRWREAEYDHLNQIEESCRGYFARNPYNGWFRSLDQMIAGARASYYGNAARACHLDLIPFATSCKWTELATTQRTALLQCSGNTLGFLLRDSKIRLMVLNGKTVVENLQRVACIELEKTRMDGWELPRRNGNGIAGIAYRGSIRTLCGVKLGRSILVLGYNHNIQSSFGVTTGVKNAIRDWITEEAQEVS
jgi:hypothetical protein